jgi:hypothetical protein
MRVMPSNLWQPSLHCVVLALQCERGVFGTREIFFHREACRRNVLLLLLTERYKPSAHYVFLAPLSALARIVSHLTVLPLGTAKRRWSNDDVVAPCIL